MVANPIAIGLGGIQIAIVVGFMVVTVVVYYHLVRNTQTHRPPPVPLVEDPPKPSEDPKPEPKATTGPTPPIPPEPPKPPKPKPRCEVAFPEVINCSYIQQAKYPDLKSALDAVIRSLPRERQKRPFSTNGSRDATARSGANHTTYWSADRRTKITIGCYTQCCKNTETAPSSKRG